MNTSPGSSLNEGAVNDKSASRVKIDPFVRDQLDALKALTRHYVILGHDTLSDREGQRRAVEVVFDVLRDAARKEPKKRSKGFGGEYLFPREYRTQMCQVFCVNGRFFSLRRRHSGRWESGNPDLGFPLFHGPQFFFVFAFQFQNY